MDYFNFIEHDPFQKTQVPEAVFKTKGNKEKKVEGEGGSGEGERKLDEEVKQKLDVFETQCHE